MLLSRMRHRRGFGIHSPFAYSMVKDVIAPSVRYLYYNENDVAEALLRSKDTDMDSSTLAMTVFRWCSSHNVNAWHATASVTEAVRRAVKKSRKKAPISKPSPKGMEGLMLVHAADMDADAAAALLNSADAPVTAGFGFKGKKIAKRMNRSTGVLFYAPNGFIFFPYTKTSYVSHDIDF